MILISITILNAYIFKYLKCLLYNIKEKFVDEEIIKEMDTTDMHFQ